MKLGSLLDARSRRLALAIFSGVAGRFATLIAPFITTPAILHYFGDVDFGLWVTSISITSIAVIADLGIGNGLLTRVATAYGSGEYKQIQQYVSSAYAALACIAAFLLVVTIAIMLAFPGMGIVGSVFIVFFLGLPGAVFYQFLYGIQKVPTMNAFLMLAAVASVLGCLAAIHLSAPHWVVVVAYALPPVGVSFAGAAWYFLAHREFAPGLGAIQWHHARDLLRLGSGFFALSILTAVGLNIDNLIISTRIGPAAVASYSIPMRLGSLLGLVILALFMPLWGANGEALAKGEYRWVERSAFRMSLLGATTVLLGGGVVVLLSSTLIQLWVGRTFQGQELVMGCVVAGSAIIAATSPYNMVLNAMGRISPQIWPWLAFVLISIPLKLVLIRPGALWPIAAVTGAVYALTVAPAVRLAAGRALRAVQMQSRRHPL